jgi:hypothetical protein
MPTDVETQAGPTSTQDPPAGAGANDQFLGIEPDIGLEQPEPEQTPEPEGEGEPQQPTEGEETAETETQETATDQAEETDDNWLPTDQEKEFPLDVLARYGKRYGYTLDQIQANAPLQNLLKDKINSDILIAQQQSSESFDETAELGLDEQEEQALAETTTTPTEPADPRAQHYQRVDSIVTTMVDPKSTEELGKTVLGAMGVNTDIQKLNQMLQNPNLTPEQRADVQGALALTQNAGKVGGALARGAVDLMLTALPNLLPDLIEQIYPGTQERFERGIYADAWNRVTGQRDGSGKPVYTGLPQYGSREFTQLVLKTEKQLGLPENGFGNMTFRDAQGRPLPTPAQAVRKYQLLARVASGQRVNPQAVAQAVETGRRQEKEVSQRRAAGRALGAGQSSRQFDQQEPKDEMRDALREQIAQTNMDALPVTNLQTRR